MPPTYSWNVDELDGSAVAVHVKTAGPITNVLLDPDVRFRSFTVMDEVIVTVGVWLPIAPQINLPFIGPR